MDIKTTRDNGPVDNRSRVYRLLRNGQRPEMGTTTHDGTRHDPSCETLHRQRSSDQTYENSNIPSPNPTCGAQVALYPGTSRSEVAHSSRDSREGESGRHTHEINTNEYRQPMEEEGMWNVTDELFNELFNEIINEEVLFLLENYVILRRISLKGT